MSRSLFASDLIWSYRVQEAWEGPVVRRDPATYRRASRVPVRCQNTACRHWLTEASHARGWCETCHAAVVGTT